MVIGRRHLDKIHPDQVQRLEPADKFQPLPAGQPAHHGRAGAGSKGRVQPVNIKGQIDRRITCPRAHNIQCRINTMAMHPRAGQDFKAMVAVIIGAQPDLCGAADIDNTFGGSTGEHRAMVKAGTIIRPGITMCIKLYQRQRAMPLRMRLQQRIGNRMIATEAEHHRT